MRVPSPAGLEKDHSLKANSFKKASQGNRPGPHLLSVQKNTYPLKYFRASNNNVMEH